MTGFYVLISTASAAGLLCFCSFCCWGAMAYRGEGQASKDTPKDSVASMQPLLVGNVHVGAKQWVGGTAWSPRFENRVCSYLQFCGAVCNS